MFSLLKYIQPALLCIVFLNLPAFAQVPVYENVDPSVAQFPTVRGNGDPDYTGDLNVNIPLLTVPDGTT